MHMLSHNFKYQIAFFDHPFSVSLSPSGPAYFYTTKKKAVLEVGTAYHRLRIWLSQVNQVKVEVGVELDNMSECFNHLQKSSLFYEMFYTNRKCKIWIAICLGQNWFLWGL